MQHSLYDPTGARFADITTNNELKILESQIYIAQLVYLSQIGFTAATPLITVSGTSEVPFAQLRNPNASGKTIRVFRRFLALTGAGAGGTTVYRFYRDPTVTANGTSQNIQKILKSQSATTVASLFTAPTVSANGTLLRVAVAGNGQEFLPNDELDIIIQPNEVLLVTAQPSATGFGHLISWQWVEV